MPFDLSLPALQFPLLGNSLAVAIPSLLHIVLAGLSVGFLVLAPIFEWYGRRAAHCPRRARQQARTYTHTHTHARTRARGQTTETKADAMIDRWVAG